MVPALTPLLMTLALTLLIVPLVRASAAVRGTTLVGAVGWSWAAWGVWLSTWVADGVFHSDSAFVELGWYTAALLTVCPALSILGAKRPGARVWTLFVVLPFLLVFTWPLLADWVRDSTLRSFQVELPMCLGYVLVLVMGFGNYVGTRWTLPAILIAGAAGTLMWTFDGHTAQSESDREMAARMIATGLLCLSGGVVWLSNRRPNLSQPGLDEFWDRYRNAFGIVWAIRFMERVNATAEKEQWFARWELDRIAWQGATEDERQRTLERMEHTVRWLGRRFVDPEWLDEMMPNTTPGESHPDQTPS